MNGYLEPLGRFFEQGGPVTWAILGTSVLMWTLILERYWFHMVKLPIERRSLDGQWNRVNQTSPKLKQRIRETLIAAQVLHVRRFLSPIRTLTAVLPLLGLLGTVTGMIETFDVMSEFGQRNVRGMAAGISQALFTTMAGLMTALSGYFFSVNLDARARVEERRLERRLK